MHGYNQPMRRVKISLVVRVWSAQDRDRYFFIIDCCSGYNWRNNEHNFVYIDYIKALLIMHNDCQILSHYEEKD